MHNNIFCNSIMCYYLLSELSSNELCKTSHPYSRNVKRSEYGQKVHTYFKGITVMPVNVTTINKYNFISNYQHPHYQHSVQLLFELYVVTGIVSSVIVYTIIIL